MTLAFKCRRPRRAVGLELTAQVGISGQPFLLQHLILSLWLLFFSVKCKLAVVPRFSVDSWFTCSQKQR